MFCIWCGEQLSESLEEATAQMVKAFKCSMVCVTAGTKGSAYALADGTTAHAPILPMADQVDATGAGDAYMGGMVAAAYHWVTPRPAARVCKCVVSIPHHAFWVRCAPSGHANHQGRPATHG